jgi:hypothetical protein
MLRLTSLLLFLLAPALARASAPFPSAVQSHLSLSYAPACSLCHLNGVTGLGTVTTPFGVALRAHGAAAGDVTKLDAALDAMRLDGTDSDCDGVPDIQELINGTDPNVPDVRDGGVLAHDGGTCGTQSAALPGLTYGCGGSVAPGLVGGLAALVLARRRRR